MPRTDRDGHAHKGSQRHLQEYVNNAPSELNRQILDSIPSLPRTAEFLWVSPLRNHEYREYRDSEFLSAIGQTALLRELERFWPFGGPSWDALGIVDTDGPPGVLLVEAKAHPDELKSVCGATSEVSIQKIRAALDRTKSWLNVPLSVDWYLQYYQTANRLAHLYFLREIARVPAWLANLYFVDDASYKSTSREVWDREIREVAKRLGLAGVSVPYAGSVFLQARTTSTPDAA